MATGFLWHELFAWHDAGRYPQHQVEPLPLPDTPDGKRRIRNLLEASGLLAQLTALSFGEASDKSILRVHSPSYLARLIQANETGGIVGRYAHIGSGGLRIVRLAAGAALAAVDAVLDRQVTNAYALIRPAGHHAVRDGGMGFCIINNVAIAALHAIEERGLERIAIVDWDVHHGNGAQEIFWEDPRVLAISLHQEALFAGGGGWVHEVGQGDGLGTTLNVPLPPGSGHAAYIAAFERIVLPALERFQPSLMLVASGLDATSHDSLGRMMLHSGSYREMTAMLMESAKRLCAGRLILCHEGGYSPSVTPFVGLAILETLSGLSTSIADPFIDNVSKQPGQRLLAHQREIIELAAANVRLVPSPNGAS